MTFGISSALPSEKVTVPVLLILSARQRLGLRPTLRKYMGGQSMRTVPVWAWAGSVNSGNKSTETMSIGTPIQPRIARWKISLPLRGYCRHFEMHDLPGSDRFLHGAS